MATYILFWNPGISSYTMDRFQDDFKELECVGNWSFFEHENVEEDDFFYMIKCGEGRTGIVMRGVIESECYEDVDWSPKGRKPIYYADIRDSITINPETAKEILTPEKLTEIMPDFNWFGGHSGRRLSEEYAEILDKLWIEYITANAEMFNRDEAHVYDYDRLFLSPTMEKVLDDSIPHHCEFCGYSYDKIFDSQTIKDQDLKVPYYYLITEKLPRLIYRVCRNCQKAGQQALAKKMKSKE